MRQKLPSSKEGHLSGDLLAVLMLKPDIIGQSARISSGHKVRYPESIEKNNDRDGWRLQALGEKRCPSP
jgi:hypothetical protein